MDNRAFKTAGCIFCLEKMNSFLSGIPTFFLSQHIKLNLFLYVKQTMESAKQDSNKVQHDKVSNVLDEENVKKICNVYRENLKKIYEEIEAIKSWPESLDKQKALQRAYYLAEGGYQMLSMYGHTFIEKTTSLPPQ